MRGCVAILVLFIALTRAPCSFCKTHSFPDVPFTAVKEWDNFNGNHSRSAVQYINKFRMARPSRALRHIDILATCSVVLAILFLLVRCAAYISDVSGALTSADRRLAEGSSCGGEVS